MRTIYYKEAPENPESLKVILKDYFEKESPVTYWMDTNNPQCSACRNRSIDDLILLANHYFPGSTCKDVLNVYVELTKELQLTNKDGHFCFFHCCDIKRPVLLNRIYTPDDKYTICNLILYQKHIDLKCLNSEYTIKSMKELLDND